MKYKILVVDDDKELVKMLCSYFNMKQYETITATDGMEALNKIEMKPDIILLDINMPRMDGIEVCRLIRSKVLFRTEGTAMLRDRIIGTGKKD